MIIGYIEKAISYGDKGEKSHELSFPKNPEHGTFSAPRTSNRLRSECRHAEDQIAEISGELMCPVCEGQSVAESNAQLARDMRAIIKTKLLEGRSRKR